MGMMPFRFGEKASARTSRRDAMARRLICGLALVALVVFAPVANADIKTLRENGKVTWGTDNNPQVIYLLNGEVCDESDPYDEIVLKFTETEPSGSLTVASGVKVSARALVVGGGGAGGTSTSTTAGAGGGGGAGGFIDQTQMLESGTYTVIVGKGGEAATTLDKASGNDGGDSSFVGGAVSLIAKGGGGGGAQSVGKPGGSGGGGSYASAACNGGSTNVFNQGNIGGRSKRAQYGAGGGGAFEAGDDSNAAPGQGGDGKISDITGSDECYAGGGTGGRTKGKTGVAGGDGGGGKGGSTEDVAEGGRDGYGGGGGGSGTTAPGGKGGDGVVILRIRDVLITPPGDVALEWNGENQIGYEPKNYYEFVGGTTNETKAGTYTYQIKPADGFMWADGQWTTSDTETKTIEWKIAVMTVDIPTPVSVTYDGDSHEVASSGDIYEIVDGTAVATNAGEYSFTMRLKDTDNTVWSDGSITNMTTAWSIVAKAVPKPTPVDGLIYSGTNSVAFTEYDGVKYVSGVTNSVNAGSFDYKVKLDNPAGYTNYVWIGESGDASIADETVSWGVAPKTVVVPTAKTDLVYNGEATNAFESLDWSLYELASGKTNETSGGTYEAKFHLTGNDTTKTNYVWDTTPATFADKAVEWTIAAASNEITVLSIRGWRVGGTPSEVDIDANFGEEGATFEYGFGPTLDDVAEWITDKAAVTNAGQWFIRATIDATPSWTAATRTEAFQSPMWDDPEMLYHDWTEITIKARAGATETLVGFPVPVRISETRMPGFTYEREGGHNGEEMVFVDKSGNLLPYEVDTWNTSGESVVWVRLEELPPSGTTIMMFWNLREGMSAIEYTPDDVWDDDYVGIWHMPASGTTVKDSKKINNGTMTGTAAASADGKIGAAASLPQSGAYINCGTSLANSNLVSGFTIEGWANSANYAGTTQNRHYLFGKTNFIMLRTDSQTQIRVTTPNIVDYNPVTVSLPSTGGWFHYALSFDTGVASGVKLYINGELVNSQTAVTKDGKYFADPTSAGTMLIGTSQSNPDGQNFWGLLDEYRLSKTIRSAEWLAAEYASVADDGFTTNSIVQQDGLNVDYWVVEPSLKYPDMLSWDIDPKKNADAAGNIRTNEIETVGELLYGEVTNYIYSVYDTNKVYRSISEITEGGEYCAVFARIPTDDFQPLKKVIEFRITKSKPYTKIGGTNGNSGRMLLMNRDTNDKAPIDYQGYSDNSVKDTTTSTFWQHLNANEEVSDDADGHLKDSLFNLYVGTRSMLWTKNYGNKLWHLVDCRHGNTYPKGVASGSLEAVQNYLPYSGTSKSFLSRGRTVTQATAGQVVMRNMEGATVYSPCYTNGIGTIYFDAVNGWKGITENNNIVVEIATNTIAGLPPTDDNCIVVTTNAEDNVVSTNWYGKLDETCWNKCTMRPFVITNGVGFVETNSTKELALQMDIGGRNDSFYRVVVPINYHGAIRFRIRRTTAFPEQTYGIDEGGLILLDNIIASIPAMGGSLESPGHYDETKSGQQQLGWELATSVPYPSTSDEEVFGGAVPNYYVNSGDGSAYDTGDFFHSAVMHYRWRYLDQVTNDWQKIEVNPTDGFKAMTAFDLPGHACDVEYWYSYVLQAPFYSYVDYSGIGKALGYTEERGTETNACRSATIMASCGTNWFFRVREGKSDYAGLDIVFRREGSEATTTVPMILVDDNVWRGFVQTMTNQVGKIDWRIEARDRQTEPYAQYEASTNHFYCTTADLELPVSDKLDSGSSESWSSLDLDAATGYVMFQVDEQTHSLTVVHADYQNFNSWSDAKGGTFVGNSTENETKTGTSPKKQTFTQDFDTWTAMSATDPKWEFTDFSDIRHLLDRDAYVPFESATDGLWEAGPGMWISKKYKNDSDGSGVALQMEGQGKGFLRLNDADYAPRGVESVTFNARLAQFMQFRDFNYYNGERHLSMTNYTFITRAAFDRNSNANFSGNASLSLVARYLQNKGCYEARWEWIGTEFDKKLTNNKGQRLCLYRWNVTSTGAKETLLAAWTNTAFSAMQATSLTGSGYMPFYITVSNDTANACTRVAAGVRSTGMKLGDSWPTTDPGGWYVVAYCDKSNDRLVRGTYGVLSANCDGVIGRPQYSTQTMLTADELGLAANTGGYYSNKSRKVPTGTGNIFDKDAGFGNDDETEWNIMPGRMTTVKESTASAIVAAPAAQHLYIYLCSAGKSDWDDSPAADIELSSFGRSDNDSQFTQFTLPLYTTKDCGFKFTVGGLGEENRTDVVIYDVKIRQFRGDNYSNGKAMAGSVPVLIPDWIDPYEDNDQNPGFGMTNWIFTSAWITNTTTKTSANVTTNGMLLLSARRTKSGDVSSVRSPLMDNYRFSDGTSRGSGLGMVTYDYVDAQQNARLLVQIATNNVQRSRLKDWDTDDDSLWTTVATNDFSTLTETERRKGTISTYIGLHGVKGLMRIVVDPALVSSVAGINDTSLFGEVKITKVVCRDEPALDDSCWWGWNMRTVGKEGVIDAEGRMFLPDYATDSEDVGMSLALNNSVTADIDESDAETYKQNVPFVQTPTFAADIVGEVSFKARRYDVGNKQPASVTLYGSHTGADDSEWKAITNFVVEGYVYQTYAYKTGPSSRYAAFRLGVSGVPGVVKHPGSVVPEGYDSPVRVMIDEVSVCEAVYARMAFKNVGTIRNRDTDEALNRATYVAGVPGKAWQPLCNEGWGVQCEVYAAQLANEIDTTIPPVVILHWFEGKEPWGFGQWKDKTKAEGHFSAALSVATDTNGVYRSSYVTSPEAVVPMSLLPGTVVQYMLEVRYRQASSGAVSTNFLTAVDWERPSWYRPLDLNAQLGGNAPEKFSAYCILDTVAPGWAWINEVNIHGSYDADWNNSEANCQFVEIAVPVEADISSWRVELVSGNVQAGDGAIVTNTIAEFGTSELPGTKPGNIGEASNMVFRVVACPKALTSGTLKASDGTLDQIWEFREESEAFKANNEIFSTEPFGIRLVRPSGVVEHEVVCIGTNFYGRLPGLEQYYSPTNAVEYYNRTMSGSAFFYAGEDCADRTSAGEFRSLSVLRSSGEDESCWTNAVKRTPGRINDGQEIDPDHPTPNGESIIIYCNLDTAFGHIRQIVGDLPETNTSQMVFIKRGSERGTNIVYTVDPWYQLASVRTNGHAAAFTELGPCRYTATVGVGASNNVTVVAAAQIDERLQRDFGVTPDNAYTPAIMDWLAKGTDLYGRGWANPDSGEVKLADFIDAHDVVLTNLNLTQMYWLDMDPTVGGLALKGYVSDGPWFPARTGDAGQPLKNVGIEVFMQITNRETGAAWAPYALRGLEPGSNSIGYTNKTVASGWKSATFKMVGFLDNGHTGLHVRDYWVPLRWFVLTPESFAPPGSPRPFTSRIEVKDPFSTESPAYDAGWYDWAQEHGTGTGSFYFWCLDERIQLINVEVLKEDSTYGN